MVLSERLTAERLTALGLSSREDILTRFDLPATVSDEELVPRMQLMAGTIAHNNQPDVPTLERLFHPNWVAIHNVWMARDCPDSTWMTFKDRGVHDDGMDKPGPLPYPNVFAEGRHPTRSHPLPGNFVSRLHNEVLVVSVKNGDHTAEDVNFWCTVGKKSGTHYYNIGLHGVETWFHSKSAQQCWDQFLCTTARPARVTCVYGKRCKLVLDLKPLVEEPRIRPFDSHFHTRQSQMRAFALGISDLLATGDFPDLDEVLRVMVRRNPTRVIFDCEDNRHAFAPVFGRNGERSMRMIAEERNSRVV